VTEAWVDAVLSVSVAALYFWPAISAVRRGLPNVRSIVLINVLVPFGWWLAWAE